MLVRFQEVIEFSGGNAFQPPVKLVSQTFRVLLEPEGIEFFTCSFPGKRTDFHPFDPVGEAEAFHDLKAVLKFSIGQKMRKG